MFGGLRVEGLSFWIIDMKGFMFLFTVLLLFERGRRGLI